MGDKVDTTAMLAATAALAAETTKLKVGDLVKLSGQGPTMTIEYFNPTGTHAYVVWFVAASSTVWTGPCRDKLPVALLAVAK